MGQKGSCTGGSVRAALRCGFRSCQLLRAGIVPYINASIILQLLATTFPSLKKLQREEGPQVRLPVDAPGQPGLQGELFPMDAWLPVVMFFELFLMSEAWLLSSPGHRLHQSRGQQTAVTEPASVLWPAMGCY